MNDIHSSCRPLAIDGGEPAFPQGPPKWPVQDAAVRDSLAAAFESGDWGRYHGQFCEQLAARLCMLHGVEHSLLCSSGTMAVELALRGLKVGPGDEVILAGYDFPGNFRAIEAIGAVPVLVDVAPGGWCLDADQLAFAISPQVRAIVVSHLHGTLADMRAILAFAREHGIVVVEDACQSPGAIVQGRLAGAWGDAGVLSFGGSKLLTAGRGGAVLTQRDDVAQRIRIFSDRGNHAFPLSELQAAALIPQCDSLAVRNAARLRSVQQIRQLCSHNPWLCLPPTASDDSQPSYYKLGWFVRPSGGSPNPFTDQQLATQVRRWLIDALQAEGIAIDAAFRGFVRRSSARCRVAGSLERAAYAATATMVLHHPVLLESEDYIARLCATLNHVAAQVPLQ